MIEPGKLNQLEGGQKRRKLALTFGALERDIAGIPEKGMEYNYKSISRADYTKRLCEIVLDDPQLPPTAKAELEKLLSEWDASMVRQGSPTTDPEALEGSTDFERRACNLCRNNLLAILGTFPAEWDLIVAPHPNLPDENGIVKQRDFFPGVSVYCEDIRSPFNLGAIFRTAEAMGCEKVYISPLCTDPNHTKAQRSSMGCIETLGFERKSLDELPDDIPIFVLETGGTDINEFEFPKKGICIIGSEELGVSPAALKKATYGRVTIPMKGLKASLNVSVAFGILMQKWVEKLQTTER